MLLNIKKKTKIVCTIGPASDTPEMIYKLYQAGMNVMRVNFSHGTHEEQLKPKSRSPAASRKSTASTFRALSIPKVRKSGPAIWKMGGPGQKRPDHAHHHEPR
jgi:pyruvate kinase